ncbi:MAG: ribosome small subunit-dependent GTPase A [Marinifilaceae bacterium]|nr:ribosome small subunit-dependent GTPase A [Marinifilaceae bacterium]
MKGKVIKSTGSWYLVRFNDGTTTECRIRGKFRMKGIRLTNPVAVGDIVEVEQSGEDWVITKITERRNYIIRKSVNLSKEAHVLAANVDLAALVVTISHPETSLVFIDRFLAVAEAYSIPALLIFNKTDIYTDDELEYLDALIFMYEQIGYPCMKVSGETNKGVKELFEYIKGKTSVFSGQSGVGKSTLINAMAPDLKLKTGEISSAHDSGRHTTTFAEMFDLPNNTSLIDTPGIRGLGMVDMTKEELPHYFPEIFKESANCRFNNCSHTHEPGCAVLMAIEEGKISESRYASYIDMLDEQNEGRYRN